MYIFMEDTLEISSQLPGTNELNLCVYVAGSLGMAIVLALSRSVGMAQLAGGRMLPEFLANKMKAGDVMCGMYWKKFGQKPPE